MVKTEEGHGNGVFDYKTIEDYFAVSWPGVSLQKNFKQSQNQF